MRRTAVGLCRFVQLSRLALPCALALSALSTRARAQEPEGTEGTEGTEETAKAPAPEQEPPGQRYFGFGPSIGFWKPNGLFVRAGIPAVELEAGGGYMLNYASYTTTTTSGGYGVYVVQEQPQLKVFFALQGDVDLLVHLVTFKDRIRGGLRAGPRYNEALGYGVGLGGQLSKRMSAHWLLEGNWGVTVFPDAAHNLRRHEVPSSADFRWPPAINWGLNVAVLLYP